MFVNTGSSSTIATNNSSSERAYCSNPAHAARVVIRTPTASISPLHGRTQARTPNKSLACCVKRGGKKIDYILEQQTNRVSIRRCSLFYSISTTRTYCKWLLCTVNSRISCSEYYTTTYMMPLGGKFRLASLFSFGRGTQQIFIFHCQKAACPRCVDPNTSYLASIGRISRRGGSLSVSCVRSYIISAFLVEITPSHTYM